MAIDAKNAFLHMNIRLILQYPDTFFGCLSKFGSDISVTSPALQRSRVAAERLPATVARDRIRPFDKGMSPFFRIFIIVLLW
jgi:hypothetical protein